MCLHLELFAFFHLDQHIHVVIDGVFTAKELKRFDMTGHFVLIRRVDQRNYILGLRFADEGSQTRRHEVEAVYLLGLLVQNFAGLAQLWLQVPRNPLRVVFVAD